MNSQSSKPTVAADSRPVTPLLQSLDLRTYFPTSKGRLFRSDGWIKAVDGVNLAIVPGETLGLVGETGCGKSTLGRTLLRLIPHTSGRVLFEGENLFEFNRSRLRVQRRHMQMIFQDPVASLNPRMTAGDIIAEPLRVHRVARGTELRGRVVDLLERVGLSADDMNRYPHVFSGGQRQRIGIARALALNPKFIVCDEPVSALDVSIQSQILNLLADLKDERKLSYLFIAHNLAVVRHISDRVAVMYLGKIVETASAGQLYRQPRHPYTLALLASVPKVDPTSRQAPVALQGEPASPSDPPGGCAFHPRCPFTTDVCRSTVPRLETREGMPVDHLVACHHADRVLESDRPDAR